MNTLSPTLHAALLGFILGVLLIIGLKVCDIAADLNAVLEIMAK